MSCIFGLLWLLCLGLNSVPWVCWSSVLFSYTSSSGVFCCFFFKKRCAYPSTLNVCTYCEYRFWFSALNWNELLSMIWTFSTSDSCWETKVMEDKVWGLTVDQVKKGLPVTGIELIWLSACLAFLKFWIIFLAFYKLGIVIQTWNPSTQEVKARGPDVQGFPGNIASSKPLWEVLGFLNSMEFIPVSLTSRFPLNWILSRHISKFSLYKPCALVQCFTL